MGAVLYQVDICMTLDRNAIFSFGDAPLNILLALSLHCIYKEEEVIHFANMKLRLQGNSQ
jgi:hypothetical protein